MNSQDLIRLCCCRERAGQVYNIWLTDSKTLALTEETLRIRDGHIVEHRQKYGKIGRKILGVNPPIFVLRQQQTCDLMADTTSRETSRHSVERQNRRFEKEDVTLLRNKIEILSGKSQLFGEILSDNSVLGGQTKSKS